jgi:hypothetical protein
VLLDVAMAGPLAGVAASGALLAAGLALTAAGAGDVTVDSPALADSFVVGLLGQLVLGEALASPEVGGATAAAGRGVRGGQRVGPRVTRHAPSPPCARAAPT